MDYNPYPILFGHYDGFDYIHDYYFKVYCRASPYLLGFLFGIFYKEYYNTLHNHAANKETFLFKVKKILDRHYMIKIMTYIIGLFIILFLTYYPRTYKTNPNSWEKGTV